MIEFFGLEPRLAGRAAGRAADGAIIPHFFAQGNKKAFAGAGISHTSVVASTLPAAARVSALLPGSVNGSSKPKRNLTVDEIIPYGI